MDSWRYNFRKDHSDRTAITRGALSSPARWLKAHNLVLRPCLDYGCGKGADADRLGCACYDPAHQPTAQNADALRGAYRTILVHYVLNTVPSAATRARILRDVRELLLPGGVAYVAVRTDARSLRGVTKRGTWQGKITLPGSPLARGSGWAMWAIKAKEQTMAKRNPTLKSSVRARLPAKAFATYKYNKRRSLPVYRRLGGKLQISIAHVNNALARLNQTGHLTAAQRRKVKADLQRLQRRFYDQQGEPCPETTSGCVAPAPRRVKMRNPKGKKPQYKIQVLYVYGWDEVNDEEVWGPFDSRAEAQAEIDELMEDVRDAVSRGYMDEEYDESDYRVVAI
jgi:hypothetical protein